MTARRALVVDDSRSARTFLRRVLERYEIVVDGVESAEQALEYLTHQRPDVIFMDHLMPGMDGFQAVQAIKNNPRTATIPIMMYTSQEGELYLSQARALGAIGVLPKQIRQVDVSKALEQLHLIDDASPVTDVAAFAGDALPTDSTPPLDATLNERRSPQRPTLPALPPELRSIIEGMFSHQVSELRRLVIDNLESHADRIIGDVRQIVQEQVAPAPPAVPAPLRRRALHWGVWFGAAALVLAAALALQWVNERHDAQLLRSRLLQTQQTLADTQQSLQSLKDADAAAAASAVAPLSDPASRSGADAQATPTTFMIEPVPFGETPLSGARLEHIQALLTRLAAQGFHGVVQIRSVPGRFCLTAGAAGLPALAADAIAYAKCDQVGTSREDNGSPSGRQSVAFANMIATARANAAGRLDIQINAGSPEEVITPYPPVSENLTAGDWNRVAAANNRVEVHWQADH
jgi:CheY-like chemotaxis protein